jgi:hypothetical protein
LLYCLSTINSEKNDLSHYILALKIDRVIEV